MRQLEREAGGPLTQIDIEVVQCRGFDADEHLALFHFGIGDLFIREDLDPAVLSHRHRVHNVASGRIPRALNERIWRRLTTATQT
jgi:hypothetical protein